MKNIKEEEPNGEDEDETAFIAGREENKVDAETVENLDTMHCNVQREKRKIRQT